MLTDDWILRQVDDLARLIARLVLNREDPAYRPGGDSGADALHLQLAERLEAGDIGGAEDLLFAQSDWSDPACLGVALDFYTRLNRLTDAQLEAGGFDRMELQEGLQELAGRYGIIL